MHFAIAHTDIQGSTRLWERLGPAFATMLADHNRIVREAARRGREVSTEGDSFTFAFGDANDAAAFAIAAQQALHEHAWPAAAGELFVRIGVHAGDVPEGGDAVATLEPRARLAAAAAHGGQALLTRAAREAGAEALRGAAIVDLGEHRLAPHDLPETIFQALPASLASRAFPPPRTLSSRPTNLAPVADRFVGRDRALADLAAMLPSPAGRLVTLTGAGGMGKTRLAREVALAALPQFEGGCWFADLMEARTATDVSRAAAAALGIPLPAGEDPAATVADALEFRKPLLLVLDGFEALVDHAAATVGAWMKRARHARFLVTSLSLLGLSGEREVGVEPLTSPDRGMSPAQVGSCEAARLFLDRAARARPGFALNAANAVAVGRICAELEGIPLALEVAAARLADLEPEALLASLERSFDDRTAGDARFRRRQSLAGALEWSYGLLSDWQRSAFQQACVFRGGFFLEAAEEVLDLSAFPDAPLAIDAIQALRDRSLLRTQDSPFGTRFTMFRAVRELGEKRMRAEMGDGAWAALEDRHARHYVAYARKCADGRGQAGFAEGIERLELELDNVFAVQDRTIGRDPATAARAILAIEPLLGWRGPFDQRLARYRLSLDSPPEDAGLEARLCVAYSEALVAAARHAEAKQVIERGKLAAARSGSADLRMQALLEETRCLIAQSRADETIEIARRALAAPRDGVAPSTLARAFEMLSAGYRLADRFDEAMAATKEGLVLARAAGDQPGVVRGLIGLANAQEGRGASAEVLPIVADIEHALGTAGSRSMTARVGSIRAMAFLNLGDGASAAPLLEAAVATARDLGQKRLLMTHLNNLGRAYRAQRKSKEARQAFEDALRIAREIGDSLTVMIVNSNLGMVSGDEGDFESAMKLFEQSAEVALRTGQRNSYAIYRGNIGSTLAQKFQRPEEARVMLREAVAIYLELGVQKSLRAFNAFVSLAAAEQACGDNEAAAKAAQGAISAADALGLEKTGSALVRQNYSEMKALLAGTKVSFRSPDEPA